jgi:hypothetical protein
MANLIVNRLRKAQRYANALEEAFDAEAVAGFDEAYWQATADRLGEQIASPETRDLIVEILLARERALFGDPFEGVAS